MTESEEKAYKQGQQDILEELSTLIQECYSSDDFLEALSKLFSSHDYEEW